MCGLFGFVSFRGNASDYVERGREALGSLSHRGPDQWSDFTDVNVYMGHRRLSILDLSEAGRQPMSDESGEIFSAVNGEIYNYPELRKELSHAKFRSNSDSEIVLHGYRKWGIDKLLERIDGMYAFSLYDRRSKQLILARDRVGIKPLYFAHLSGWFVWASELKAIESFFRQGILQPDTEALYDFLTYRYIPSPKTPYKSVAKLRPAHYLRVDLTTGKLSDFQYWQLPTTECRLSIDETAEELKGKIATSVRSHLASDVPFGCFLSGGIDSSIVSAHAQKITPGIQTFSIGFDDPAYDETAYAEMAAREFGTTHYFKRLAKEDSVDLIPWMRSIYDEPFGDYSALPTWHVSNFAKQRVTVALSGDGGDELFGGYTWYRRISRIMRSRGVFADVIERIPTLPYTKRPKNIWRKVLNRASLYATAGIFELYVVLMNAVPLATRKAYRPLLQIPDDYDDYWFLRKYYRPDLELRKRLQFLDFHTYLPEDILTKLDRASMAVSLESRVPLLSTDLVEFAFSLSEEFLYLGGNLKGGLKYAYRDVLPPPILQRGKKGFGIPVKSWRILEDTESFEIGVLDDYRKHYSSYAAQYC